MTGFNYTSEQLKIINAAPDQDYRVCAVAGSGKTSVITQFAARLLTHHKVKPETVLMVTFSVSATNEMRERLSKITPLSDEMDIMTLHSLCFKICRDSARNSKYANRRVDKWPEWRTAKAVKDFLRDHYYVKNWEADKTVDEIVQAYEKSKAWPKGQWAKENDVGHPSLRIPCNIVFDYIERCKEEENGIDFGNMTQYALELLEENKDIRKYWGSKYSYIIVDEFQDTDRCQYEVLLKLLGPQANLMVVGDLDQCIFSWRGAMPEIMFRKIMEDRKRIVDLNLTYNFRSGKKIVSLANNVIRHNEMRVDQVQIYRPQAPQGYIMRGVAPLMFSQLPLIAKHGCPLHEIAILNRYNADALIAEAACIAHGLPYFSHGTYSMSGNKAVQAVEDYIRLILNTDSIERLDKAISQCKNIPLRKIPQDSFDHMQNLAKSKGVSILDFLISKNGFVTNKEYVNLALHQLVNNILRIRKKITVKTTLYEIAKQVRVVFNLDTHFQNAGDYDMDPVGSIDNYISLLKNYKNINELNSFVEKMKELKADTEGQKNSIQILTGHKSKGLEFEVVFVHAETKRFPRTDSNIEEERRLFYVMSTRSKSILLLSGDSQFVDQAVEDQVIDTEIPYEKLWLTK